MTSFDTHQQSISSGEANSWFVLRTPLGKDALIVTHMVGVEKISRLFDFTLTAVSEKASIKAEDLLGKSITLDIGCYRGDGSSSDGEPARRLNGIVTRFQAGRFFQDRTREYCIEVAPKLWITQRSSRYRIYQNMSAKDIIMKILDAAGVSDVDNRLSGTFAEREYCVQYGETDFEFITRLMSEEGIFYYFKHEADKHTLILCDDKTWSAGKVDIKVAYNPGDRHFYDLVNVLSFGPGLIDYKFTVTDYDFQNPNAVISGDAQTSNKGIDSSWEHQIHASGLPTNDSAAKVGRIDIASAEAGYETGTGEGTTPHFAPGLVFELDGFGAAGVAEGDTRMREDGTPRDPKQASASGLSGDAHTYVVAEVRHDGIEPSRYTQPAGMPKRAPYRNDFVCVRPKVPLPRPVPPQKPLARGPMTALVVGPSGSEIHTDKYGRIRVQFYWDRDGRKDEKSSCFVRVAQPWSGKNWGAVFVPRVGMEVVVQFLDGDPDRPLVTGTVYNGTNLPPWTLPDKMTKSGILTRSTKDGAVADANELSFDDDKGKEVFLLHAQRDLVREVEHDEKITVEHDQITEVTNDRTTTIKDGNDSLTVKTGNQTHEVSQGNRSHTVKTGNDTLEVSLGNRAVTVKTGNHDLKLNTGNASTKCDVGQIKMEATSGISLVCGQNKIELTPAGITINGITVSIKGTAMLEEKAPILTLKGDGMTTIEGGLVKIN